MSEKGTYPSKIMLVGEYGVVLGGSALTLPFHRFSARIRSMKDLPSLKEEAARQSHGALQELFGYIQNLPDAAFHAPPDRGLFSRNLRRYWLDLDIPVGAGLGSSGAASAAIYDLFFPGSGNLTLQQQKEDLAAIESFFHGRSSGVDALTCHAGVALRFHVSGRIDRPDFNPGDLPGDQRLFLLDSGERDETGPLVRHFLDRMRDPGFKRSMEEEYLPLNERLIEALLREKDLDPAQQMKRLSTFQLEFFRRMIPRKCLEAWREGLLSGEYYLKLNGSGGAQVLGMAHRNATDSLKARWGKDFLWLDRD
jgi:mevalonate kinase